MSFESEEEKSQKEIYREINFEESDEDEDNTEHLMETFIEVELRRSEFKFLKEGEKERILKCYPKELHEFVSESYILHESEISTVLLRKRINLERIESEKYQKQKIDKDKKIKNEELIVLKATKHKEHINQEIFKIKKIELLQIEGEGESYSHITKEDFKGINLYSMVSYFSSTNFIKLENIYELAKQLVNEVKELHENNIIHGDINIGNILIRVLNEKEEILQDQVVKSSFHQESELINKNSFEEEKEISVEALYKTSLWKCINKLYDNNANEKTSERINLSLVDYSHSWIEKNTLEMNNCIEILHKDDKLPSQTINYRSPEALHNRGRYEIDIWDIGHVLFTLLTGEFIFNPEIEWTIEDLEQIFSNPSEFYSHINTKLKLREELTSKSELKLYHKLINIIMKCLSIQKEKRPKIQELEEEIIAILS